MFSLCYLILLNFHKSCYFMGKTNCVYNINTLHQRARKKLTGKEDWFKKQRKRERDEYDEEETDRERKKRKKEPREEEERQARTVSVMFVPYTRGGELAKRLREVEEQQARQTGIKIKIVERTGRRIVDILHKADPWQGQDCGREGCLLCQTKQKTGKLLQQDCTKRSVIYETWCMSCEKKELERIEGLEEEEKEKERMRREIRLYKYLGETSRSFYERALEHQRDLLEMKTDSHMLKHYFEKHLEEEIEEMEFGGRLVKQCRSAFNRQIGESVEIQNNTRHFLLNS